MATLIGLLAATGMRIGEALRLNLCDLDWQQGVLNIHRSKFRRSRLVPIHASTTRALRRYATRRNKAHRASQNPSFFVSQTGKRLQYGHVHKTFLWLLARIGLPCSRDRHGPGLHDMRHRFAVNTLVRWYRAGLDVDRHMLLLSTYLGHRRVVDTYWYLSAAPELMGLARARLERNLELMP
jgi:integrase